jgi:hypothetical protein
VAGDRDIDLLLLTGAGASYGLGASPGQVAAMKEWSDQLARALIERSGYRELTDLSIGLSGPEFEEKLGRFLVSAGAFRDGKELMVSSAGLFYSNPILEPFRRRESIAAWHEEVSFQIDEVFEVIRTTLYDLFGIPSFDYQRACRCYGELLDRLAIARAGGRWVYATTNYDKIGDEALEGAGYPIAWGERPRARGGDRLLAPFGLLDGIRTTVPILHLHGRVGWYRRREQEGGEAYASDITQHNRNFGTPIVMLPSPNKSYQADEVIDTIWELFKQALSRSRRVLVLGHSLNDSQIVDAIAERAVPGTVAVTVYGDALKPDLPEWDDDPVLQIREEKLPNSTLIPIRFGEEGVPHLKNLDAWVKEAR